jgi:hypothetical protein
MGVTKADLRFKVKVRVCVCACVRVVMRRPGLYVGLLMMVCSSVRLLGVKQSALSDRNTHEHDPPGP